MRKLIMTMTMLLLTVTVVTAQRSRGQRADDLLNKLELSNEQWSKIKTVRDKNRARMQQLRGQNDDRQHDRSEKKQIRQEANVEIQAILTPEQRQQLKTLRTERKAAFKSVGKKAMKAELKEHSNAKIKPVITAARARFDQVLSAEDRAVIERLRPIFTDKPGRKTMREGVDNPQRNLKSRASDQTDRKATSDAWKKDHASEIAELKALTSRYAAELKSLRKRMLPQRKQWRAEKREIAARYLPERSFAPDSERRKARKHGAKRTEDHPDSGSKQRKADGWPRRAAFLLIES